jgi:formamidopyrimidine-DNA glycosylase
LPELPEVETTCRGIEPHLCGRRIVRVDVRDRRLRWPVDTDLPRRLEGQRIVGVSRRAKYLLLEVEHGTLIVHLGMSGSLRVVSNNEAPRSHDHVEIEVRGGRVLRLHDPRRFGSVHYTPDPPLRHWLLANLGVEPLCADFDGALLKAAAARRRSPVKTLVMDARVVVGVGNIYACESLFLAGIDPRRAAMRVGLERYRVLASCIQRVLADAIRNGGTTLRDFVNAVGEPGYFAQSLNVYGRAGEPCTSCGSPVRSRVIAQRNTFFCSVCQR